MCTVIYIPTKDGVLMCSVRDENPNRSPASQPKKQLGTLDFWSPIDSEAGGTWWGINEHGQALILLNGAFENHLPNRQTYRKSRGLIVKEMAEKADLIREWDQLDLVDIEPFTLVIKQDGQIVDCRWDGKLKHCKKLDHKKAHIWSSATLYPKSVQEYREQLFGSFMEENPEKPEDIIRFLFLNQEKNNGFIMNRSENLRSLSISVFHFKSSTIELYYDDLLSQQISSQTILLS